MNDVSGHGRQGGLTLIELIVVLAIFGVLMSTFVGFAIHVRKNSQDAVCLHNLRQISTALLMYHQEYRVIPVAQPQLSDTLAMYLSDPSVFVCPADRGATADSYSPFYVPHPPSQTGAFLLGCDNHGDEGLTPGVFAGGRVIGGKAEPVIWDNRVVAMGDEVIGGTLRFVDGTEVRVAGDLRVIVLTSFTEDGGKSYSAIRIPTGAIGSIEVNAAHGTRFDIVTPACTAGVRGTRFTVFADETSEEYRTNIAVQEGVVAVDYFWPELRQQALAAAQYGQYILPKEPRFMVLGPTFAGKYVFYKLKNTGNNPLLLSEVSLNWPVALNTRILDLRLDGVIINDTQSTSPSYLVSSGWIGSPSVRTIDPGVTRTLAVRFFSNASSAPANYEFDHKAAPVNP